ncbi:MAG TPA: hypothetical protein VNA25_18370 [Phycisphaerae bacterium]|nr:hypothetical protein [Phycisphaerae bacterium]
MRRICAIACLALSAGSAASQDARKAWDELFAQPVPAEANAHIRAVLDACGSDAAKLKALIAADTTYETFKAGWMRRTTKVADGNTQYEVEFIVRVPRGYTLKRPWPVLLACHGQGGSGQAIGQMMEGLLGAELEKYVIVAPTMPGPAVFNGKSYQEQSYLKPLGWARLHLNVDDDRIYVSGYSLGGHNTWHLATMYSHLFAAAVPMAGAPVFECAPYTCYMYLENLGNVSLWSIWGENDTADGKAIGIVDLNREARDQLKKLANTAYRGTELPGVGHAGCLPKQQEFQRFLASHKRVRVPEKLTYVFHLWHHRRAYYLQAIALKRTPMRLDGPLRITVRMVGGKKPTQEDFLKAGEKMLLSRRFRIAGELDRSTNALTLRGEWIRIFRVRIPEGMFDLSRDVLIRYGSRLYHKEVTPSAECILRHYAATRDATNLVCNEIDMHTAGKVTVRYPAAAPAPK